MPKITDYTAVTTLTPSDTLMDVSIDIATTPKTRSITIENLATAMDVGQGSFYITNGSVTDALRTVDFNGNTLYFAKVRMGVGDTPSAGSETVLIQRHTAGEAALKVACANVALTVTDSGRTDLGDLTDQTQDRLVCWGRAYFTTDNTTDVKSYYFSGAGGILSFDLSVTDVTKINLNDDMSIINDIPNTLSSINSVFDIEITKGGNDGIKVDDDSTAGNTRLLVYDVDNATLERVTVGAADSGGAGFKVLRIPN